MFVLIYRITSPSGKSYIGQTVEHKGVQTRWKQHINTAKRDRNVGSTLLNSAIIKYGENTFTVETICKVHMNIKDITEQFCISYYNTMTPNGYNLQSGGTFTTHSEITKMKRSLSIKKMLENPEKRKIWSDAKKGKPQDNKNNRKYPEDNMLPKYIRRIRGKYEGYCIDSHPLCNSKKFTSRKISMEEKLIQAKEFLKKLDNTVNVQRLDGSG